jgi:hypothetical protein
VDGTYVGLSGDSTGLSSIVVSIAAKDSTNAYIQGGQAFTDPVFGSFKVAFNGLTPSLSDSSRDAVTVTASNTQTSASLKDYKGNAKTLNFANIDSSNVLTLNASVTQAIHVVENEVVNLNDYFLFAPTQESEFGHILKLSSVSGIGGSSPKFTL